MRKPISISLAAVFAMLALGACSSSSDGGSVQNAAGDRAAGGARAALSTEAAAPSKVAAVGGGAAAADAPPLSAAKIRTAAITVAVRGATHVAERADQAGDIATRVGGEVDSDDRTNGRHAQATLRLRVPPDQLRSVLRSLSALGTEISRESSTTDVTERVADVTSRLGSARESIARLRALYDSATKVADVIAIESELSGREADLESLEAQQRTLSRQTSMASVTLYLETAATHIAPPAKKAGGFVGGLQRGWDGFVSAAGWVASAVGTLLPFLVLLAALAVALRLLGVRLPVRGRRTPPTPEPSPAE